MDPNCEKVKEGVIAMLRDVYDPEIPVNVYDLGLIYEIKLTEENDATVRMTLTTPNCPAAGQLPLDVRYKVQSVPGIRHADVEITWDPPWSKDMMSEAARLALNL